MILIAGSGQVSALHVHDYTDHDHPEHHHGLAVHEHHVPDTYSDDGTPQLEGCSPGRHTISYVFVCAAPAQSPAVNAEFETPGLAVPDLGVHHALGITDIRVHGPPSRTQAAPRAPPLIFLA